MAITVKSDFPETKNLAEIYQSCKLKMALMNQQGPESYERITCFVMCRDFLTDVCSFSTTKGKFNIYGMEFDGTKKQVDFSQIVLLLDFPDDKTLDTFKSRLEELHNIELANGIEDISSFIHYKDRQWVIRGNKQWVQNCLLFSLYSLLIRSKCLPKEQASEDKKLLKSLDKTQYKAILASLKSIETPQFCGYPVKEGDISRIHHNSGFISVFGKHREINWEKVRQNSHWQEMKRRGMTLHKEALAA